MERFFVSGINKSGTTFLQMLLDSHPAVNCPSEQHFKTILRTLGNLSSNYHQALKRFDETTANQGVRFDEGAFTDRVFRAALIELMQFGVTEETTHTGLNDNSLFQEVDYFAMVMPEARFVFLIRDPRDVGISLWHHRARNEPKFVDSGQTLEATVMGMAKSWPSQTANLLRFQGTIPDRACIVRYEDLIGTARDRHLASLLDFLSVPRSPERLADMWQATDFDQLKKRDESRESHRTGFFRSGKRESWRDVVSPEKNAEILRFCKDSLTKFGYDCGD